MTTVAQVLMKLHRWYGDDGMAVLSRHYLVVVGGEKHAYDHGWVAEMLGRLTTDERTVLSTYARETWVPASQEHRRVEGLG